MADDIAITPGAGASVATDDVGGRHFQVMKVDVGGNGASAPLSATDRMPVYDMPAVTTATTGSITTAASTVVCDVTKASNLVIFLSGTFTGVNITFEASVDGGTNYFAVTAVRTNANTIELTSGVVATGIAYGWELSVNGYTHMRVRATAYVSGTATVTMLPGIYATEPIPAIQTHAVTGSGNFAVTMAAHATNGPAKARDAVAGASDTGIPAWFIRRDTPTALTPAAGDWEGAQIDSRGSQWTRDQSKTTSAVTSVAGATSSTALLASNAQRRNAKIFNDSGAILYINEGATASTTAFTVKLLPDEFYETDYTGALNGIWSSATGSARITEITP